MNDKVKTIGELRKEASASMHAVKEIMNAYEYSRSSKASEEERFNEGRHGRMMLQAIDETSALLTQLRMRVQLQLDGRDNARAKQLDRILGIAEEDDNDGGGEDE